MSDSSLRPELRRWRWVARLRESRIAFLADDPEAAGRLGRERTLLGLLGPRVSFAVPAVEHVSPDGRLQVRRMVEGVDATEWLGGYACQRRLDTSPAGRRLAGELGRALAELHGSVLPAEAEALGVPEGEPLPSALADLHKRLSGHLPEPALEPALDAVLERCAAMGEEEGAGRVLIHGDPCAANLVIDPEAGRLVGMFDFEHAALADRHENFYSLHAFGDAFTEGALDAYAAASGVRPSMRWVALHHVYAAFFALAGALAADDPVKVGNQLRWVRGALAGTPGRLLGLEMAGSEARWRPSTQAPS